MVLTLCCCLKMQSSLSGGVKECALSGFPTTLHQSSFPLTYYFFVVHTPVTWKVIRVSFYPQAGHSMAGQVSHLSLSTFLKYRPVDPVLGLGFLS